MFLRVKYKAAVTQDLSKPSLSTKELERRAFVLDDDIMGSGVFPINRDALYAVITNVQHKVGENKDNSVIDKLIFGYSSANRKKEAAQRTNVWLVDLDNREDPSKVLHDILSGAGGDKLDSYQYLIASELTGLSQTSDDMAKLLVERLKHAVRPMEIDLDSLYKP